MTKALLQQAHDALLSSTHAIRNLLQGADKAIWPKWLAVSDEADAVRDQIAEALAQPEPAPAVPNDAALNTLAKMFHSGEEIEGDNGAAMMVDMALWHEASEAFDSLIGEGDGETLASSAAPAVPLTTEQITQIARKHGIVYTNRHYAESPAVAFSQNGLMAFLAEVGIGGGGK